MSLRKISAAICAAVGMMSATTSADAAFSLEIRVDGALQGGTIVDGGFGDQDGAVNGKILVTELLAGGVAIADFQVDIEFVESKTVDGVSILTNEVNVNRTAAGSGLIEFLASATGYVSPLVSNVLNSDVAINDVLGTVSAVYQSWADPNNGLFAIGAGTTTTGAQNVAGLDTDAASTPFDDPDKTFSLTSRLRVTMGAGSETQITADTNVTPVPEPGTLALLAMGGVGLAGARWRRKKST